jgi:hypothetical protein
MTGRSASTSESLLWVIQYRNDCDQRTSYDSNNFKADANFMV